MTDMSTAFEKINEEVGRMMMHYRFQESEYAKGMMAGVMLVMDALNIKEEYRSYIGNVLSKKDNTDV